MDDRQTAGRWVSAWSTSPVDASLSETGMLDRLGVAVMDVSARTAVHRQSKRTCSAVEA